MSWRNRVRANIEAGAYKQKENPMNGFANAFAQGFVSQFNDGMAAKRKADADQAKARAEALKEQQEKEQEQRDRLASAKRIALGIFGSEAGKSQSVINTVLSELNARDGDYQATFDWMERSYKGNTLSLSTPSIPSSTMTTYESGSGGYDALLNQSQNNTFSSIKLTNMSMDEIFAFSAIGGDYHKWSKDNVPEGTYAHENGLGATPMGMYQFVGTTLRDMKKRGAFEELGITGSTQFDKDTQDKLFLWLANDTLKSASTAPEKVAAMRNVWEGLQGAPDADVLKIIEEIETGTFAMDREDPNGPVITMKPITGMTEEIKLDFKGIDSLSKFRNYQATLEANETPLTPRQTEILNNMEQQFIQEEAREGRFDFVKFMTKEKPSSNPQLRNAITVIENTPLDKIHTDPETAKSMQEDYIRQLQERIAANTDENAKKALADGEDVYIYRWNADGTLNTLHEMLRYDQALMSYVDIRGNPVDVDGPDVAIVTSNDETVGATLRTYNGSIKEVSEYQGQASAATQQLLSLRATVEQSPEAFNSVLQGIVGVVGGVEGLEEALATAVQPGSSYQNIERDLYTKFSELGESQREVFSKMLRAAYDMASLKGSRGQGLSDKELMQNLEALGFGANKAEKALAAINVAFTDMFENAEARRQGLYNAIQAPDFMKKSFANQPWGQPIEVSVRAALDDTQLAQLDKALAGDTTVVNQVVTTPEQKGGAADKLNAALDKVSASGQSIGQLLKSGVNADTLESIVDFYVNKGFDEQVVRNEISNRIRESSR